MTKYRWINPEGWFRKSKDGKHILYHLVREGIEPEFTGIEGIEIIGKVGIDGELIYEKRSMSYRIPLDNEFNQVIPDRIVYYPPTDSYDERYLP